MRQYKWNKYGFKISLRLEVPKDYNNKLNDKLLEDKIWELDYLGDWEKLYSDNQAFMYPSLFTYFMGDLTEILIWYIYQKKYGKDI